MVTILFGAEKMQRENTTKTRGERDIEWLKPWLSASHSKLNQPDRGRRWQVERG
jgi:hypothetical protein